MKKVGSSKDSNLVGEASQTRCPPSLMILLFGSMPHVDTSTAWYKIGTKVPVIFLVSRHSLTLTKYGLSVITLL